MLRTLVHTSVSHLPKTAPVKSTRQALDRLLCKTAASAATFLAPTEQATCQLAELLAANRAAKDCICLYGKVGAGKSVLSRAYIRAVAEDNLLPVPSPTYLLQNIYDFDDGPPVHHFDLYRMGVDSNLNRLNLQTSFQSAVSLVEWADRLGTHTPAEHLSISMDLLLPAQGALEAAGHGLSASDIVDKDEEGGAYADRRWRLIRVQANGKRWEEVLARVVLTISGTQHAGLAQLTSSQLEDITAAEQQQ